MPRATGQPPPPALRASCQFCRRRKIKCSGEHSGCSACLARSQPCVFLLSAPMGRPRKHPSTSSGSSSVSSLSSVASDPDGSASDAGSVGSGVAPVAWDGLGQRWGHGRGSHGYGHGRQASWAGSVGSGWSEVSAGSAGGSGVGELGSVSGESVGSEARRGINFDVLRSGSVTDSADDADLADGLVEMSLARSSASSLSSGRPPNAHLLLPSLASSTSSFGSPPSHHASSAGFDLSAMPDSLASGTAGAGFHSNFANFQFPARPVTPSPMPPTPSTAMPRAFATAPTGEPSGGAEWHVHQRHDALTSGEAVPAGWVEPEEAAALSDGGGFEWDVPADEGWEEWSALLGGGPGAFG